ncbi:hypothetical protein [Maribacter halichondriae]|uniref:hypothetical protein n=1 Tax=Maribacter halichondriae TaxID=2980554 RepID=UPI002358274A|nr:hypothetical protein [Maribacter sp. Hal144]
MKRTLITALCFMFVFFTNCKREDINDVIDTNGQQDEQLGSDQTDTTSVDTPTEDISLELVANDLEPHPMQDIARPISTTGHYRSIVRHHH